MSKRGALPSVQSPPRPKFPRVQQYANHVYNSEMVHRDNSSFLKTFMDHQSLVLTRPTQLGKTTLFSLVELVFSKDKESPESLEYEPPAKLKNSCFVLRVDFGAVNANREGAENDWEEVGRRFDKNVRDKVEQAVHGFLNKNANVATVFRSLPVTTNIGDTLEKLARAVESIDADAHFFVLVDEYDQPMRDILLDMLVSEARPCADDILSMQNDLKNAYPEYIGFFKACKTVSGILPNSKLWLTGITPLALPALSGFIPQVLTFDSELADVVGLCDEDVDRMLDQVHTYKSFKDDDEKARVRAAIKEHYNGLMFLSGSGLYHIRLVNDVMNNLSKDTERREWIQDLSEPMPSVLVEECPSSVFNVVATDRSLRPAVNKLVTEGHVSGILNRGLSLSHLFTNEIATDDYLTLLVHLGILSVCKNPSAKDFIFTISSGAYRKQHLDVLLKSSLGELFKFDTLNQVYQSGVVLIEDFLKTLSATRMRSLINWARKHQNNHIMELQLQGFMVGDLYNELYGIATTQQEIQLPSQKRTDITLQGGRVLVILELKKLNENRPPTAIEKERYQNQLRGYVREREKVEEQGGERIVAGFIVVMCGDGQNYIVEKLTEG